MSTVPSASTVSRLEKVAVDNGFDRELGREGGWLCFASSPRGGLVPPNLRKAHHALDRAVDRLYRHPRFASERECVEYLFALYERLQAPLVAAVGKGKRRLQTRRGHGKQPIT